METYKPTTWETFSNSSFGRFSSLWFIDFDFILSNLHDVPVAENYNQVYWWRPSQNRKIYLFEKRKTQFYRRRRVLYKSGFTTSNASISCRKQRGRISKGSQFYIWPAISSLEILAQINEILMKKGMFLTFWLRTKNDYFNVKSELTENSVFKREIKTEFVQGKDGLISGKFSKATVLAVWCCWHRDVGNIMIVGD